MLLFLFFDFLPSIFSKKVKQKREPVVVTSKKKWLLTLTKNTGSLIENFYYFMFLTLYFWGHGDRHMPVIIGYIYWMSFGAFFGAKVIRYSKVYQDKYADKK